MLKAEKFSYTEKLSLDNVVLLREKIIPFTFPDSAERIPAYLTRFSPARPIQATWTFSSPSSRRIFF